VIRTPFYYFSYLDPVTKRTRRSRHAVTLDNLPEGATIIPESVIWRNLPEGPHEFEYTSGFMSAKPQSSALEITVSELRHTKPDALVVIVCGGRDYDDSERVYAALDRAHAKRPIDMVLHGAARGADTLAGEWAKSRGIHVLPFPADWKLYGKRAGPARNAKMVRERPNGCIAFPGGTGTADCIQRCKEAGIPVWQPYKSK
jgi:hypothetical protein